MASGRKRLYQEYAQTPRRSERLRRRSLAHKSEAKPRPSPTPTDREEAPRELRRPDCKRKRAAEPNESGRHLIEPSRKRRSEGFVLSNENTAKSNIKQRNKVRPQIPSKRPPSEIREHNLKRPRTEKDRIIDYWRQSYEWPKALPETLPMEYCLARPKLPSIRRSKSSASLTVPSETSSREAKSAPYKDKNYEIFLETKGSFLYDHDDGVSGSSRALCRRLLEKNAEVPRDTRFDDDVFELTCRRMQKKNEAGVIRIIAELIVPSAEGAIDARRVAFRHLVESVNEGWDNSISLDDGRQPSQPIQPLQTQQSSRFRQTRPQPDYAVGFSRQAFTEDQLAKLAPFIGRIGDTSFFMGTAYIYFPFMTCEVKCGKAALDVADRQNAHSMTLALRGVVELFRLVDREKELHGEILAFSISHDHCSVRIYGHYPAIDGERTSYYRHSIRRFDFTELNGRERWTCYKFVMSIYNDWVPSHFERLCSAIDEIPKDVNFEVPRQSGVSQQSHLSFTETTGLSQGIEGVELLGSSFTSLHEDGNQPDYSDSNVGPRVSTNQGKEKESLQAFKMSKKRRK